MIFKNNPEYIDHYFDLGFKKLCDVKSTWYGNEWYYVNINEDLMFSSHRSWVYAITNNDRIIKFGETGNPLGIRVRNSDQPKSGTNNRLGRYRKHGDSDLTIRNSYRKETQCDFHNIAFYALKCEEIDYNFTMINEGRKIKYQIHKQMEKFLLDYYKEKIGIYPESNTGRY